MGITETWLKNYISDAQVSLPGYTVLRADRDVKVGGGCLLYVHEDIVITKQMAWSDRQTSLVTGYSDEQNLLLCCIYRPPDAEESSFKEAIGKLQDEIDSICQRSGEEPEMVILGDFNLPQMDWNDTSDMKSGTKCNGPDQQILELINQNFLEQIVKTPTRGHNILDLVLTNTPEYFVNVQTKDAPVSDHRLVECALAYNPLGSCTVEKAEEDPFRKFKIHKVDYTDMKCQLNEINWEKVMDCCKSEADDTCEEFKNALIDAVLEVAEDTLPLKTIRKQRKNQLIESFKRRARKVRKKLNNCSTSSERKGLLEQLATIEAQMKESIINQLDKKEKEAVDTIKENPKFFFTYAKKLSKTASKIAPLKRQDGSLAILSEEKAEILQHQYVKVFSDPTDVEPKESLRWTSNQSSNVLEDFDFTAEDVCRAMKEIDPYGAAPEGDIPARILYECRAQLAYPLWLLWRKSMDVGQIPASLKTQQITPIFKKGDKTVAANYRPVSLTSNMIKTFERVMRDQIVEFLENNNIFPDSQHGFRKRRSCLTQLIEHVDTILKNLQDGKEVDVIYVDYAKAFDKVDTNILIAKLERYGVRGKVLGWIKSFLTDRYQTVVVDGKKSSWEKVRSGVPQGTVLGPPLFIVYVADLVAAMKFSIPKTLADDTKLIMAIEDQESPIKLQDDLDRLGQWSKDNNMSLNDEKFEVLHYALNNTSLLKQLPFFSELETYYTPEGLEILPKDCVRDLGVQITNDLSWGRHVHKMTTDARRMSGWVLRAFKTRDAKTMLILYKSLVRSKLEYCCALWDTPKISDIQSVEEIQRKFTKRIHGMKDISYWERLKALKMQSMQRRRERYSIIMVWKMANGEAPNSIGVKFHNNARLGKKAEIPTSPTHTQVSVATKFHNSFACRATRLWNTLPRDVNTAEDLATFKVQLGKWLSRFPDRPPVTGYTRQNNNSILDWALTVSREGEVPRN